MNDERCAYCRGPASMGFNKDHVVPKSLQKKLSRMGRPLPQELTGTVWSCWICNHRKGTRRLIPQSWADRLDILNNLIGGAPFRVWHGGVDEDAFREVFA